MTTQIITSASSPPSAFPAIIPTSNGGGGGGGTVTIDGPSLAALETISLDAASLAALEAITATGPLTDAQLRATAVPVAVIGTPVTLIDKSGTITAAGVAQVLAVTNAARRGLWVQNNSAGDMRINSTGAASATAGIALPGGKNALYEYPSHGITTAAISIWGATLGQAFQAREW